MNYFGGYYSGKRVMVTGHTGFKGSWLALWLTQLGAKVAGYSLQPPTEPNHFDACGLTGAIEDFRGDVLDFDRLTDALGQFRPEMIFHLAAQPIVRAAYDNPRHTFNVNFMGTTNVLDAARLSDSVSQVIVITSDKVYKNEEWDWAYRETDPLGGYEPYGASKAAAEMVVNVYQSKLFQQAVGLTRTFSVASARAGNVLGGGDWAAYRIVPDLVRSITSNSEMIIRHPGATRPWQHVLDALSGYLCLGHRLAIDPSGCSTGWNFGPTEATYWPVHKLAQLFLDRWPAPQSIVRIVPSAVGEHRTLRLDSSRAMQRLGWLSAWDVEQTVRATADWYRAYYQSIASKTHPTTAQRTVSLQQIEQYCQAARQAGALWVE